MGLSTATFLLLLPIMCSIFGGVEMAANSTNTTTQSSAATTTSTIKPGVTTVNGGSQTGSGLGWGLASGYSATTNGARSTFFPSIGGNVLHLFTLSVFFIMAWLMN